MRRQSLAHREPSGRIQRSPDDKDYSPTQIRRLRDAALAKMAEPEWGSELGRMFLNRTISPPQYAAAKRWRYLAAKYQSAIGLRPVKSLTLVSSSRAHQADPSSIEGTATSKREQQTINSFLTALKRLTENGTDRVVRDLCENDNPTAGAADLIKLRKGLSLLAMLWKIQRA